MIIIPIVSIPPSIANGLKHYKDLFPRSETFQHIQEYCKGYTYAIQLVTSAISTNDRLDGFDYKIYHRSFLKQEKLYLEHTAIPVEEQNISAYYKLSFWQSRKEFLYDTTRKGIGYF